MSKDFITRKQLIEKMKYDGSEIVSSDVYATRSICELAGADPKYLTSYGYNQYPVDDNVKVLPEFASFFLNNIPIPDFNSARADYIISPPLRPGKNWFNMVVEFSFTVGREANGTVFTLYADGAAGRGIFMNITPVPTQGILMDIYTFGGTIDGVATPNDQFFLLNQQITDGFEGSLSIIYNMGIMWVDFNGTQAYNKDITFGTNLEVPTLTVGQMLNNGGIIQRFSLMELKRS